MNNIISFYINNIHKQILNMFSVRQFLYLVRQTSFPKLLIYYYYHSFLLLLLLIIIIILTLFSFSESKCHTV